MALATTLAFIGGIGVPELLIILVIVVLIFGVGRLPQLGDALGKGIRNFRQSLRGEDDPSKEAPSERPAGELPEGERPAATIADVDVDKAHHPGEAR